MMEYLTKFDSMGYRITSYPIDNSMSEEKINELLREGYIKISEDEWEYYTDNKGLGKNGTGYIRGKDGKPTDAPAHVPTKDELLTQLENEYTVDKDELMKYYTEAMLVDDSEVMAELKDEMVELEEDYIARKKEIEEG